MAIQILEKSDSKTDVEVAWIKSLKMRKRSWKMLKWSWIKSLKNEKAVLDYKK